MTEPDAEADGVSLADAVRWLQDEGMARLASLGSGASGPAAAYTVDVASGVVTTYPVTNGGIGSETTTLGADDLPAPQPTTNRLVTVGVTTADAVLVVDLAASLTITINADRPEPAARAWVTQLLMNPDVSLTTNSSDVVVGDSPRCKQTFIPGGGGRIISVDDGRPPVTTVALNSEMDGPDHLDIAADGTGEMYLGNRFWQLRQVISIADDAWAALAAALDGNDDRPIYSDDRTPSVESMQ